MSGQERRPMVDAVADTRHNKHPMRHMRLLPGTLVCSRDDYRAASQTDVAPMAMATAMQALHDAASRMWDGCCGPDRLHPRDDPHDHCDRANRAHLLCSRWTTRELPTPRAALCTHSSPLVLYAASHAIRGSNGSVRGHRKTTMASQPNLFAHSASPTEAHGAVFPGLEA